MLRFVQNGIHKAFRSNQAYAPCQKAAHDQEEYEVKTIDSLLQQRRSFNGLASIPLSQPLPNCAYSDVGQAAGFVAPYASEETGSKGNQQAHSNGYTPPHGLLRGALFGAGCAAFNTVHAYCSGRRRNVKDRSKFCPITQYQNLQRSSDFLRSITHMLPGATYDVSPGFSVLPKTHTTHRQASVELSVTEENKENQAMEDSTKTKAGKEYEKAQLKVNSLADALCNIDKDHLADDHFLAMRAWQYNDFTSAAGLWKRTVDKFATPVAAHRLGVCYEQGHGVTQDYHQASEYYNLAISHQCSKAMYRQALLQMKGVVTEKTDSMELMRRSAELNYSKAQTFIGTHHFHKNNKVLAVKYFTKAALQDDAEACYYLGICYEVGAGVRSADDAKAAEYYQKGADGGHPDAQYNLAIYYEEGYGDLEINQEKAIHYLKKSSKQGNSLAKERLQQLGCWNMASSVSLPAIAKHLPNTLSDLAISEMVRASSDNFLQRKQGLLSITANVVKALSRTSSSSSVAGTPQFYIPMEDNDDDNASTVFGDWSDESQSLPSFDSRQVDDKFSVHFAIERTSLEHELPPLFTAKDSWSSLSNTSVYKPDHDGPKIIFA